MRPIWDKTVSICKGVRSKGRQCFPSSFSSWRGRRQNIFVFTRQSCRRLPAVALSFPLILTHFALGTVRLWKQTAAQIIWACWELWTWYQKAFSLYGVQLLLITEGHRDYDLSCFERWLVWGELLDGCLKATPKWSLNGRNWPNVISFVRRAKILTMIISTVHAAYFSWTIHKSAHCDF